MCCGQFVGGVPNISGFSAAGDTSYWLYAVHRILADQAARKRTECGAVQNRFYHRIVLTQEGSLVLRYARDVLTAQEKLMAALHHADEVTGDLHLAMSSSNVLTLFR